ncbi:MAG: endonuclease [Parabacteroides sp.]|nr:endonuclease [Parabacteroides sp.]
MKIFMFFLFFLASPPLFAQSTFRVMAYNVENLFDTRDNPAKDDDEHLPSGNRYWTPSRYYRKLQQLAKVISAAGGWTTPALIGLCEVENDSVLHHLTRRTPLRKQDYRYIITQSPDPRGINVALLYQRDQFCYLRHESIPIRFSGNRHKLTRDILHVCGKIITGDTLDVFVCHFPSRYGGEKESERDRLDAARTLRESSDSLFMAREKPRILIMGDFNDTPQDRSIAEILAAQAFTGNTQTADSTSYTYYNLFASPRITRFPGSHKYQGEWSQLDQIIVSRGLITQGSPMRIIPESIRVFAPDFLLTKDKTWRGLRPFRTYYGFKYEGGFSDHLPLIADFRIQPGKLVRQPQNDKKTPIN